MEGQSEVNQINYENIGKTFPTQSRKRFSILPWLSESLQLDATFYIAKCKKREREWALDHINGSNRYVDKISCLCDFGTLPEFISKFVFL